ncbi:MAG: hypothetical protein L3K02_07940, partial [Thermoplasmata archaeon]|nr:hypothetical protein [Thermoplasmata archaeon]
MTVRKQTRRISSWGSLVVPIIMVLGGLSLLPVATGASNTVPLALPNLDFHGLDMTLVAHGPHLPSAQPSPYCDTDN